MSGSSRLDWLKASATLIGSVAAATRAVVEYRKFRREQETLEYTRGLQRKAWQQVVDGELAAARVGDIEVKAPGEKPSTARKPRPDEATTPATTTAE